MRAQAEMVTEGSRKGKLSARQVADPNMHANKNDLETETKKPKKATKETIEAETVEEPVEKKRRVQRLVRS